MPSAVILRSTPVTRSPRVTQMEGLFAIPPTERTELRWDVEIPIEDRDWSVGLIVGPSGSGKTTIARELFGAAIATTPDWPRDRSVLDAFPQKQPIKDIVGLLSSVGFSSPPAWLRPYHVLSTGEQFRVGIARALASNEALTVVDEFTSVVDRTVARIGAAAIARTVRRRHQQFIAVTCHYDVRDWLQPDWVYEPHSATFAWRSVRPRPPIELEIRRVPRDTWRVFRHHHYLDHNLNPAAQCFAGVINGDLAVFTAVLAFPHATASGYREHRTVCLPDYQGVGIGNAMSEAVARAYRARGRPYYSTTGNPAMIHHRARSSAWRMIRAPSRTGRNAGIRGLNATVASQRFTASFRYVGRPDAELALALGVITPQA